MGFGESIKSFLGKGVESMNAYSTIFAVSVFGAGILSFFSPCIFPLLPVYIGTLIEDTGEKTIGIGKYKVFTRPIFKTLFFILGLSMVFFILGYGAGALGKILYSPYTNYIMGVIVIILGLHQMEIINIKKLQYQKTVDFNKGKKGGYLGAYLLGLTFSFGWTPCIGPVLSSVLAVAASGEQGAIFGALLMIIYAIGLSIPFVILAFASSFVMKYFTRVKKHIVLIKRIGGALIVVMGLLLMFGKLNFLLSIIG